MPADEQAVADEFEVIFTDEDGEVVHRNATPPARHYALRADAAHGGQWEGLFLVTDHMEVRVVGRSGAQQSTAGVVFASI